MSKTIGHESSEGNPLYNVDIDSFSLLYCTILAETGMLFIFFWINRKELCYDFLPRST